MTFYFKLENASYCEDSLQRAKDYFLKVIGELRNEFEENDVFVEVIVDTTGYNKRYFFNSSKIEVGVLVWKLQEYRKTFSL